MLLKITEMVLPVLVSVFIGWLCCRKGLLGAGGIAPLKSIITNITLPVVLFRAFFTAKYNFNVLLIFGVIFVASTIAILAGYLLKPLAGKQKFMPFLLTGFEAGMLGYALFGLLVGSDKLSVFAMVDIGQTVFVYTVYLALLKLTDGKKITAWGLVVNMLSAPPFIGVLAGIVLGVLGVGKLVADSSAAGILLELLDFIAAPTACLILIIVGYQLSLKKSLLKPVFITALARLVVMAALLALSLFVVFRFIPFSKELQLAMMVMFSLPAPFIIPLFADVTDDGEYISTTYSVSTLLTMLCFVGIAVYSMG